MLLWAVGLALLAQILSYLGSGYVIQSLIAITSRRISLARSTAITLAAASIGLVAAGLVGSSAAIYRWVSSKKDNPEGALLAGLLPGLLNNIVLVLASIFGVCHLLIVHELTSAQAIGFGITLALLVIVFASVVLALRYRVKTTEWVVRASERWAGIRRKTFDEALVKKYVQDLFNAWDILHAGGWRKPILGAFLNVLFDMLTLYWLFFAAGHTVSLGTLLTGYGLPLLLGKVAFVIPGGVGVIESSMLALYTGLGVPNNISVVVVLGYRLLSFWIPTLLGFPLVFYFQREASRSTPASL